MTQKIIFFDIDGTLYDHDKKLPASTKKPFSNYRRKDMRWRLQQDAHHLCLKTC